MDKNFELLIKMKILSDEFALSEHAAKEADNDNLQISDVVEAILHGEMIEYYPTGYLGPSCLIPGFFFGETCSR